MIMLVCVLLLVKEVWAQPKFLLAPRPYYQDGMGPREQVVGTQFLRGRQFPGFLNFNNLQEHPDRNNAILLLGERTCGTGVQAGLCLPYPACFLKGGRVVGSCGIGFSACCSFSGSCGDTGTTRVSHFSDLKRGSADPDCIFKIKPIHNNICQLRMDWDYLQLGDVDPQNKPLTCQGRASLKVSGGRPHAICGINGQPGHLYSKIEKRGALIPITIANASSANWKIVITQLECDKEEPPLGCSQYHSKEMGFINSYSFTAKDDSSHGESAYTICIRPSKKSCGVEFQATSFYMPQTPAYTSSGVDECKPPYVVIPGSLHHGKNASSSGSLYCKDFPLKVESYLYQMTYVPKGTADALSHFKMKYELISC